MEYLDLALRIISALAPLAEKLFEAYQNRQPLTEDISKIIGPVSRMELAMDAEHLRRARDLQMTDPAHATIIDHALSMHEKLT